MDNKRNKGKIGEDIACKFIENKGFKIIERNYLKKWGEIDIVAKKLNLIHFFEVKSITYNLSDNILNGHKPEDNVHGLKIKRIRRMIETYFEEEGRGVDSEFYFHILCVFMDTKTRKAQVKWIKNVIL